MTDLRRSTTHSRPTTGSGRGLGPGRVVPGRAEPGRAEPGALLVDAGVDPPVDPPGRSAGTRTIPAPHRANATTMSVATGLAGADHIRHSGYVACHSHGGISLTSGPMADPRPSTVGRWPMTAPRRVLIAEDEALIRLDLAEMLAEEGFEVVGEAADGEQAVALALELRPDLVILDVKMPKKDGIEAAAEIVGEQVAPVVILTAFSQRELVERARDAGAMAYLVKPFSKADLLPAIELAVARYAETAALRIEVAD